MSRFLSGASRASFTSPFCSSLFFQSTLRHSNPLSRSIANAAAPSSSKTKYSPHQRNVVHPKSTAKLISNTAFKQLFEQIWSRDQLHEISNGLGAMGVPQVEYTGASSSCRVISGDVIDTSWMAICGLLMMMALILLFDDGS